MMPMTLQLEMSSTHGSEIIWNKQHTQSGYFKVSLLQKTLILQTLSLTVKTKQCIN